MYPIYCYNATSEDKLEAVKYYVDLNKAYLKEVSIEEYEAFVEYMKGAGKDVLINIAEAKTDKELDKLVSKIDANLPYGKNLKGKTFEQKLQIIYKQFAKDIEVETYTAKEGLKKQRELASLHDQTNDVCNAYRDAVNNQRYVKDAINNPEILKKIYASKNQTKEEFKQSVAMLADETTSKTKEARKLAFKMLREYNVKDIAYQLHQQKVELQK